MVKIYVGKLSPDTTDGDLRVLFEQYGFVEEAERVRNKDIGFVHMRDEQEAFLAVRYFKISSHYLIPTYLSFERLKLQ